MTADQLKRIFSSLLKKQNNELDLSHVIDLYAKERFDEGYVLFQHLLEKEPRYLELGDVYVKWADFELLVNRDASQALELLDTAQIKGCKLMAYYYAKRGEALAMIGENEQAIQCYRNSVAEDPCAYYRSNLARALSLKNHPDARELWQQVLDEEPQNCQAHVYLAWEMAKRGNPEAAKLMEKKAERLDHSGKDAFDIATLYHKREHFCTAIKWYEDAQKRGFLYNEILNAAIADCHISLGNADVARTFLEQAQRYKADDEYVKDICRKYKKTFKPAN